MGEGGGGEELSPFFTSVFPLFPPETPNTQAISERTAHQRDRALSPL